MRKGKIAGSTSETSYLHWWNIPVPGHTEDTTERYIEKSNMGQNKTNKRPQTIQIHEKTGDWLQLFSTRNSLQSINTLESESDSLLSFARWWQLSCRLAFNWSNFSSSSSSKAKFSSYVIVEVCSDKRPYGRFWLFKRTFPPHRLFRQLEASISNARLSLNLRFSQLQTNVFIINAMVQQDLLSTILKLKITLSSKFLNNNSQLWDTIGFGIFLL